MHRVATRPKVSEEETKETERQKAQRGGERYSTMDDFRSEWTIIARLRSLRSIWPSREWFNEYGIRPSYRPRNSASLPPSRKKKRKKKKERIAESSIIDHRLILMAYESMAIEDQSINTARYRVNPLCSGCSRRVRGTNLRGGRLTYDPYFKVGKLVARARAQEAVAIKPLVSRGRERRGLRSELARPGHALNGRVGHWCDFFFRIARVLCVYLLIRERYSSLATDRSKRIRLQSVSVRVHCQRK